MRSLKDTIVHSLISGELFKFYVSEMKANGILNQKTKRSANMFLEDFKKTNGVLDAMFDKEPDKAESVSIVFENYVNTLAVNIWDMENICKIIEAYQKDPKSINGIVNKIL